MESRERRDAEDVRQADVSAQHVAVCIVSYRSLEDIRRCLAALSRLTHRPFEIIICENGGREAFRSLSEALPSVIEGDRAVRIVCADGNPGFAGGVNICLQQTPHADAWWILNPDTEPHPDALSRMMERLGQGDCDAIGCTLGSDGDTIQSYGGRWRKQLARAVSIGHGAPSNSTIDPREVERAQNYLNGASMLVTPRFLEIVGPMREDYFLYCEEVEWCLRALSRGIRIGFAPSAFVLHHQGTSTGNVPSIRGRSELSVYLGERNRILLTRDCFPAWFLPASLAAIFFILVRYGRARAWRQLNYALHGWWAGVRGERGPSARLKPAMA